MSNFFTLLYNNKLGYKLYQGLSNVFIDNDIRFDKNFIKKYELCKKYTMTSPQRMYSLYQSLLYISKYGIEGDIVECGVWKGGSSMLIAHTLMDLGDTSCKLYLYDTYSGMSKPSKYDKKRNDKHSKTLEKWKKLQGNNYNKWAYASLKEVKRNMQLTGYPFENIIFIKGKVEETIPKIIPKKISLLRLDTDWFESTYHELSNLFPLLSNNGILIIDDYGSWKGAKIATEKYFSEINSRILLHRIDNTGRIAIKI